MDIEKDVSEDLGIIFDLEAFSPIRQCENHCIFCFVDQLPAGMRPHCTLKTMTTAIRWWPGILSP
jgi:NifB/MoaA-like Fe-S oxidoreductase